MKKIGLILGILCITLASCKDKSKNNSTSDYTSAEITESLVIAKSNVSTIKVIPIEHATAVLEWNDLTIYIDPTGGASAFEGQHQPNLILITDIHGDHFNMETLQALDISEATFIVPKAVADKMPSEFASQIVILNNGNSTEFSNITIEAIPMYNLREEALSFHTKGRGNGYVLTIGGERIYFSGDTEDIPEMRALKNIDKAFICMNLPYTMTVESAASAVLEFKPKQVYPYHFRGRPENGDVVKFKKLVNTGSATIEVVQLDWYPNDDF